jgi:hypothetical protein
MITSPDMWQPVVIKLYALLFNLLARIALDDMEPVEEPPFTL